MPNYIFLVGGRTGGPIIPLLAIFEGIKETLASSKYSSTSIVPVIIEVKKGFGIKLAAQNKYTIEHLPEAKLNILSFGKLNIQETILGIVDTVWNILKLALSLIISFILLFKYQPKAVLGAGGFLIVPIVLAARITNFMRLTNTKIIIHQQDPLPGLANRLTITAADIKSCVFDYTKTNFAKFKDCQIIPNPINIQLYDHPVWIDGDKQLVKFVSLKTKPLFLIFGGGSGAQAINDWVIDNLESLTNKFRILHLTGANFEQNQILNNPNYLSRTSLTRDMPKVLVESDLVLCRAGLGSITELLYINKPSFLCPMPNSHQIKTTELVNKYFRILDQTQTSQWLAQISTAYPQEFQKFQYPSITSIKATLANYYQQIAEIMFDKS